MTMPRATATIEPDTRRPSFFGHHTMTARETTPSASVCQSNVGRVFASASILGKNSAGSYAICSPENDRTCVLMIVMAMPQVNPIVTGCGMNLMIEPSLNTPSETG